MELVGGERVVLGTVTRAYRLQSLHSDTSRSTAASDTFGPGVGPCGQDASHVMAVVVENHILLMMIMIECSVLYETLTGCCGLI